MSATLERLRRLQALRPQRNSAEPTLPATSATPLAAQPIEPAADVPAIGAGTRLEELVAGTVIENSAGACYLHTQIFPLHEMRGPTTYGALLNHQPSAFAPFHPTFALHGQQSFAQAAFLDTETTGLGGGAGVYCFMVGVGTFECLTEEIRPTESGIKGGEHGTSPLSPCPLVPLSPNSPPTHFVLRQLFMRNPAEEGALLLALAEIIEERSLSVTFNGRTFDLPLLRSRLRQNQRSYPDLRGSGRLLEAERPHLDLLHPARRVWKRRLQSCRLINLEAMILGLERSQEDVPGHLIPTLYTDYVRSGNAQAMQGVFYHNAEDVLTMVGLAEQLSLAFRQDALAQPAPTLQREDWMALAQCYETAEQWEQAENLYQRALATLRDPQAKAEAFARLGQLFKRQNRWAEAADLWQLWLTSLPGNDPTPYIELAKYCEWQTQDLEQAEMWTAWALHNLRTAAAWQRPPGQLTELEHRLARIQRKRAT